MEHSMKGIFALLVIMVVAGVLGFFIWLCGSANPDVPAGYIGYQTQGAVFGKTAFLGTIKGPSSPGRTWMVRNVNVSITPYTYTEEFTEFAGRKPLLS